MDLGLDRVFFAHSRAGVGSGEMAVRLKTSSALIVALAAACGGVPAATRAQDANPTTTVGTVTVIATTPLPGTAIEVAKAPYDVHTLKSSDLERDGTPDVTGTLTARVGGVNVNDNLDDPFQPDLLYRGFEASPVLGTPQGLAVYQNGVRINEAFGDTVNWDLIPDDAVDRLDVVGGNPVYGLNALGGAVVVTMKNGFTAPGGQATLSGGSFGQRALDVSWGGHTDSLGLFVAARGLDQDGWRVLSSDRLRQLYADLSYRRDKLSLDLSYSGADNALHGESPTPVQELAVSRRLIFTSPQLNANSLNFVTLNGSYAATSTLSVQGDAYVRDFRQSVANGNTTNYTGCTDPSTAGLLCQADGSTPLVNTSGGSIPDLSAGGNVPIGENDREGLHTLTYGGAIQATSSAAFFGFKNQFSVGLAADDAQIDYEASAEVGAINSALVVRPSGYVVATPESSPFTATPVRLHADNTSLGAFVTDTLDLTSRLSVTASGRYNWVRIALQDRMGSSLTGTNAYGRFNPAVGLTYQVGSELSLYAGYSEGSRAPTASEIECSDPQAPCLLPSSLSADPPNLKQVVSQTFEAGLRGSRPLWGGRVNYSVGLYRTEVHNDIYAVATSLSAGYFQNISGTLRQGGEISLSYRNDRLFAYVDYSYVDATFDAHFLLPSSSNPFQDANGDIDVRRGDQLPGIPQHRLKLGADLNITSRLRVGGDLQVISSQYYRGDESNQLGPLTGYAVLGLHASYEVSRQFTAFVKLENVTNARYATFGVLGDPTGIGAPGIPPNGVTNGPGVDNRFQSPGQPFAAYGGLRFRF